MCGCKDCNSITLFSGDDGVGILSTTDNNDGTFTILYTDGTTFTSSDLTGPQGPVGPEGPPNGIIRKKIYNINTNSGSQTYTVGADVYTIEVEIVGGGGAGSILENQIYAGGGGGAYLKQTFNVTPGQVITYTVGAGGIFSGTGIARNGGLTSILGMTAGGGYAPIITPGSPNTVVPGWGGVSGITGTAIFGEKGQIIFEDKTPGQTAYGGSSVLSIAGPHNEEFSYPSPTATNQVIPTGYPVVGMTTIVGRGMSISKSGGSYSTQRGANGGVIITEYYLQ